MNHARCLGVAFLSALSLSLFTEGAALACGASPGGPIGHAMCGLDEGPLEHRFRGGLSYTFASTRLTFGDDAKYDMLRHTVLATLDYRLDKKSSLTLGGGGFIQGKLSGATDSTMSSGPAAMIGYSYGFLTEGVTRPFGVLTVAGSFVHAQTRPNTLYGDYAGYTALDARFGVLVGKTFFDRLTVYAAGRLFGGPAFWRIDGASKVGTDLYHYQVGGGLIVRLPAGLDLYAEGIPLGERGFSAGLGITP
jgi:hypothetical protein